MTPVEPWRPRARIGAIVAVLLWIGASGGLAESQDVPDVDLALVLAVDCSYSVDSVEFRLQMQGLAAALRDPQVADAIATGPTGRIAVTLFQWSAYNSQKIVIPWTVISSGADAASLADDIEVARRLTLESATSISAAIEFGAALLAHIPARPLRRVIDVSADGSNNNGREPGIARDWAIEKAITITGLAIINEVPYLDSYFKRHVTGGPGNFVMVANDYQAYRDAILRKLILEILGATTS